MSSFLDTFPYPFHDRGAQWLHTVLTQLHPTPQGTVLIAQQAGLDAGLIDASQPPYFVWASVLDLAGREGLTRRLVQTVHDRLSPGNPQRAFLAGLLAGPAPPVDNEPRRDDGAPWFLKDTDEITEPEAKLFYDDLTIPVGGVPKLIQTLERLVALAPAVCLLSVEIGPVRTKGTAFRIGPDLLLTNWHVLHDTQTNARANRVEAEFGYDSDPGGKPLTSTGVTCAPDTIVTDRSDDWAVIRSSEPLRDAWPVVNLSSAVAPTTDSVAFIIQHPAGDRKRLGYVRNQVTSFDDRVVHYLTDTQEGSSGAPVFDASGRLIALHHAGGRPQQVVGKPPVKKNEGIRISRIVAGLGSRGLVVP